MTELFEKLDNWTLIKYIGGLTIIISSVISFLAYFIKDYFLNKWKSKYEFDLEVLKAKLSHNNSLFNNLTHSFSNTYLASNEKRVQCLENTWITMMEIKKNIPSLVSTCYNLLSKYEVINLPKTENKNLRHLINSYKPIDFLEKLLKKTSNVELERPFIGENLWLIYFTYQSFIGRITFLLEEGIENGKIQHWSDDKKFIEGVLLNVITPGELEKLMKNEITAYWNILNFLEFKALNDISEQIKGKRMTDEAVKHALKLSNLTKNTIA